MVKKIVFIVFLGLLSVYLVSCGRKQEALEQMQEPMSMEALSKIEIETQAATEAKTSVAQSTTQAPQTLEVLPPAGPYKPTATEIQTALKNANYYLGPIDGKIGPLTKKASEEFQKANGLQADGKVGPKTWAVLRAYLNPPVESKLKKKQR